MEEFVLHDVSNKPFPMCESVRNIEAEVFAVSCLKISSQVSGYFKKWEKKKIRINEEVL